MDFDSSALGRLTSVEEGSELQAEQRLEQIQRLREGFEIAIPRDESDIGIYAALRDQCVTEPRLPIAGEGFGAKFSSAMPKAIA